MWNKVLDGFGNHDPGRGRYSQQRSFWDVVHPGRPWAQKCAPNTLKTRDELIGACHRYLQGKPIDAQILKKAQEDSEL